MHQLTDTPLATFVVADPLDAAREVAAHLVQRITEKPRFVLGCATGRTPISTYEELARLTDSSPILDQLRTFNLDEYHGLERGHPASFEAFMRRHFFEAVGMGKERSAFPVCEAGETPSAAAARFEASIQAAGGIDLQLLGIGRNGHIAFNEPGSARDSRTRLVKLAESTREANARDFPDGTSVPTEAMTMGIATILEARSLRVLAFGAHKSEIVRRALREPVTPDVPASFLREHGDVELWLDEPAAAQL